jgi:hypothetical protein
MIGGGVVIGSVAARFRWLESTAAVVGLAVVTALLLGLGIRALSEPWTDGDD